MPYVSRPVRPVRDDPTDGETVRLLLRVADDAAVDDVADAVESLGGTVESELAFETLVVTVGEPQVAALCELDGLEAVETDGPLGVDAGDAGEDVDL